MPYYLNPNLNGILETIAHNDGNGISVRWATAYPTIKTNKIGYHIYFSEEEASLFAEGPKFFVKSTVNKAKIPNLTPGILYHFAVRAVEYNTSIVDVSTLVNYFENLYLIPTTLLSSSINDTVTIIPILDAADFPTYGVIKIGVELIRYQSINLSINSLTSAIRGYDNSQISSHDPDGYDGYETWSSNIRYYIGTEETNPNIFQAQCRFDIDHYSHTVADGYKQTTKDILTTDLAASDQYNVGFQPYDYAGWHRTDPVQLLNGECVGSYIGGEQYCADGYEGVGRVLRGMTVQEQNNQRQELLLSVTGSPVVLLQRQRTGYRCKCFLPASEHPDDRCEKCYGTGYVAGWQQYYNPRRSDGRIMIKFGPSDDHLKTTEFGLESEMFYDCWTLTVPTVKDRDIIIKFDQNGNEEYRYEIISVTRNIMLESLMGGQKFKVQRIRKTDPAYQIKVFRDTAKLPSQINTTLASSANILPHRHVIVINENVSSLDDINQMTGMSQGHSHSVIDGVVQEVLGHTHDINLA